MYFFDLEDYYSNRVIGNQNIKVDCDTWSDIATTYRATRDAYFKSLDNWYNASTTCLEPSPCKTRIDALWLTIRDGNNYGVVAQDMLDKSDLFFDMMENCDPYNETLFTDYVTSLDTLRCTIEELTYLVDNEIVQVQ